MITVMLSLLLSGPEIIKLIGFFVLYDFSFKWFPTHWKRWLFYDRGFGSARTIWPTLCGLLGLANARPTY
jgi:hypothetical protein